jgi:hypothetical protein
MADTHEIVVDGPKKLRAVQAMLARAAPVYWSRNEPLLLTVTTVERPNTNEQKRYWSGPVLDAIASQARWNGQQYPKEFWREYFRRRYLLRDEYTTPDGEILPVYWSTADRRFSVRMMADFLDKVIAEAMTEWGVVFDA